MGKLFRGKFLSTLERAMQKGAITLPPSVTPAEWSAVRRKLYSLRWIVYAKPPFGGPDHVFRYLGRYTHRVGISNQRLIAVDAESVTFATKGGRKVTLSGVEFLRRFVQHVLPPGFAKIRHYGLVASRNVTSRLACAIRLLSSIKPRTSPRSKPHNGEPIDPIAWLLRVMGIDLLRCPRCGQRSLTTRPLLVENDTS
jgi:hypothetical protein